MPRPSAQLIVINPSGNRSRVDLAALPFTLGRQSGNSLVLRDSRISREHARVVADDGQFILEDCASRHGTYVNGERIERHVLQAGDQIGFGLPDSYTLQFEPAPPAPLADSGSGIHALAKLRSLVEVARALHGSLTTDEVLASVVEAALTITGTERGFLLLKDGDGLNIRVARNRGGASLPPEELRVPRQVIRRALDQRKDLLSMTFQPDAGADPGNTVQQLDLRSVVCVPLLAVKSGAHVSETAVAATSNQTVGLLYLDSRVAPADLSTGNRELLQTLALEASTILENARLLEQELARQKLEEELRVAREIQAALLPRRLPDQGWFAVAGACEPCSQVAGDYYDAQEVEPGVWAIVVADVSGKGLSSALLAALLQGALATSREEPVALLTRLNGFLLDRTEGEKYATVFYGLLSRDGRFRYVNAAHPAPLLLRAAGPTAKLHPTGQPLGLLPAARFTAAEIQLHPGDRLLLYTDGLSEAQNAQGCYLGESELTARIAAHRNAPLSTLLAGILAAAKTFTGGGLDDDLTLLALDYRG